MKRISIVGCILVALWAGQASADCTTSPLLTGTKITMMLSGKQVCASPGTGYPGNPANRWQEEHMANGQLWDYKLGPTDPVDPRKQVGTWSVTGDKITHTYTGGQSYSYDVRMISPTQVSFCVGSAEHAVANIIAPGPCGSSFPAGAAGTAQPAKK